MSSEPTPAPASSIPVESAGDAAAPLKPLLNPLQTDTAPPASTVVEPPRSPNPLNTATDGKGNNAELDLPSASASVVGPGEPGETGSALPSALPSTQPTPVESPAQENAAQPPLPIDAPVPPTPPQPKDEAQPTLPADAIPPAVSTPTVITTEQPVAPIPTPGEVNGSGPVPATPLADALAPAAAASEQKMDIDPQGESREGSLKRAGDDLEGREEKRAKEEVPSSAPAPLAETNTQSPALGGFYVDPNAPPPPWVTYVEPPARPAGPTTPLTITQHKHLLTSVRSLKKIKEAINFLEPVDVLRFGIPHYAHIITSPMDISTVETKLIVSDPRGPPKDKSKMGKWDTSKGRYGSVSEVVKDVRQIWENTRKFNGPDHVVSMAAKKLDDAFEKMLKNLPAEPLAAPPAPVGSSPAAGPSTTSARRQSISQVPAIRRSSDGPDSRPKREIHPPASKDLGYTDVTRKPKRRNDPQLQWALRTLKSIETTQKYFDLVSPFIYPVEEIIKAIPDYAVLIKQPIDLLHIKRKLEDGEYDDATQVDADIRLMLNNAKTFNPPHEPVYISAVGLGNLWAEKWKTLPSKDTRSASEDPLADDYIDEASDEEDEHIAKLENQIASLQNQIAEIRSRRAARQSRPKKTKTKPVRKQSVTKMSPGPGSNGTVKKPRKSKDISYRDEDDAESEEEPSGQITMAQKQELASSMENVEPDVLQQVIQIIQQSTDLGSSDEIELDIDSLPPRTVMKLYNLVVRGGRKPARPRSSAPKKTGRKATGGASRKFMNEDEEAERIRRMEAQLQSFDSGRGAQPAYGYEEEADDSSDEESSDDE